MIIGTGRRRGCRAGSRGELVQLRRNYQIPGGREDRQPCHPGRDPAVRARRASKRPL